MKNLERTAVLNYEEKKFEEKWTREYDGWKEQCLMGARGENCE